MDPVAESRPPDRLPRFEILGPLRAWYGDSEIQLGPGKQRAVLGVLLVNANQPVPTHRVVDAVWADEPPQNGSNVVQKYVAGLRRSLEPDRSPRTPGKLLSLTDAGYLLRVPPGHLDLDVFHESVRRARAARTERRLPDAAGQLRQALALWRGEPLSGLDGALFDATRDRLTESRAAAMEEWADIELELGHHRHLVGELVRLVTEFPLRERLRYLLMLALYRCGRQAEALAAYRDARAFLSEEFGIEPSAQLQELHQRILHSDPGLDPPPPTPVTPPTPAPAMPAPSVPRSMPAPTMPAPTMPAPSMPPHTGVERRRSRAWLARIIGVLLPLLSFGLLGWGVVAYLAGRRESRLLGLAAAGHLALVVVFIVAVALGAEPGQPPTPITDAVGMTALFLAWIGSTVHVALLDPGRDV